MGQAAQTNGDNDRLKCFPVSPHLILPRARGEFEVYLKQGERFVLYSTRGERFTEAHRTKLAEMGVNQLWVKAMDQAGYERYVAEYLGEILDDESIPLQDRAATWGDVSVRMLKSMLGKDLPEEVFRARFAKLKGVIRSTMHFFTDPFALKELSYYMGKGFSSYKHGLAVMAYSAGLLSTFDDLDQELLGEVCVGAMLHDIGKARLPGELIDKDPRLLDDTDKAALASHPALGVSVCSRLSMSQEALNCILFHHERCDGSGYPSGATRGELPFYTRALALANEYDNLTRQTRFQRGRSPFEALTAIKDQGGAFDMELLKRFIMVLSSAKIM